MFNTTRYKRAIWCLKFTNDWNNFLMRIFDIFIYDACIFRWHIICPQYSRYLLLIHVECNCCCTFHYVPFAYVTLQSLMFFNTFIHIQLCIIALFAIQLLIDNLDQICLTNLNLFNVVRVCNGSLQSFNHLRLTRDLSTV